MQALGLEDASALHRQWEWGLPDEDPQPDERPASPAELTRLAVSEEPLGALGRVESNQRGRSDGVGATRGGARTGERGPI